MPVGKPRKHTLLPQHTLLCSSLSILDSTTHLRLHYEPHPRSDLRLVWLLYSSYIIAAYHLVEHRAMGLSFSRILSLVWSKKEIRILILGLVDTPLMSRQRLSLSPNAYALSRTTLARPHYYTDSRYELRAYVKIQERMLRPLAHQIGEVVTTIPTIGFNVECRAEFETPDV